MVAAIHVDASPWIEDNLWALQTAQSDPIMVGVIGNFRIEAPDFPEIFARHAKNPLLRGLRYGNLWRYDIVAQSQRPEFIAGLKLVSDAGLALDTANPRVDLLQAVVRLDDALPDLRIVIDHLCKLDPKPEEQAAYDAVLREIAKRPNIFVKLSSSLHEGNVSPAWPTTRRGSIRCSTRSGRTGCCSRATGRMWRAMGRWMSRWRSCRSILRGRRWWNGRSSSGGTRSRRIGGWRGRRRSGGCWGDNAPVAIRRARLKSQPIGGNSQLKNAYINISSGLVSFSNGHSGRVKLSAS